MAKIQVNDFKGIMPKIANDKLPNNMAQTAADLKTASGELVAYRRSTADVALAGSAYKTFFEYLEGGNNHWVYYDLIAHWVRSPIANDSFERMYVSGADPGVAAQGTITFTDGMTDGETLTIGDETFEYDISEDGVGGGNTLVGDSTTTTKELAASTLAALTPSAAVTFTDNLDGTVTVTAESTGTAGNAIVFSEVAAHITLDGSGLLGGTTAGIDKRYIAFVNDIQGSGNFDFTTDFYFPGAPAGKAPTIVPGASVGDYVAYYYTFVSRYGEEGPPSAIGESAAATDDGRNDVDDITYPDTADDHLITTISGGDAPKINLYRTATDGAGAAVFLFCLEATWFDQTVTYSAGDYVFYGGAGTYDLYECTVGGVGTWAGGTHTFVQGENVLTADLGAVGTTLLYDRAPVDLTNLRGHPNGFFVASKGNTLYFSEPFAPWAWPTDYQIPIDQEVVGVGIYGSTIVVATDGHIYTFSGPHPGSLYKTKLSFQPCLSQRALVETDDGVLFPSLEGFQHVTAGGVSNVTSDMFKPEDWVDYEVETMHGTWYNKAYYGFYKSADYEGYIILDMLNGSITTGVDYHWAGHVALIDGEFRTIKNSDITDPATLYISSWDADTSQYRNYMYKSPRFITEKPVNFKVAQLILDSDFYQDVLDIIENDATLTTLNAAAWAADNQLRAPFNSPMLNEQDINGDTLYSLLSLGVQSYVSFKVWVDSELKFTKQVSTSEMFKLPRGFRCKQWEFGIEGMIPVKRMTVATSVEEIV